MAAECAPLLPAISYPAVPVHPDTYKTINTDDALKGYNIDWAAGLQGHVRFTFEGNKIRYHLHLQNDLIVYHVMSMAILRKGKIVNWVAAGAYPGKNQYNCGENDVGIFHDPDTSYTIQIPI